MTEPYYGWRARIGVICVDSSWNIEGEFHAMTPDGVSVHSTRIFLPRVTVDGLGQMRESTELEHAVRLLAGARVDSIVYGGTSVSFLTGNRNSDGVLLERMESEARGIPCTTTTTAVVRALHAMNLRRIAVATPYNPDIDARLASYFEAVGFEVVSIKGEGIEDPWEICARPPESIYPFVRSADHPDAEAVFVSCADYRVGAVTEVLEEDLGKPVIGAIQASYWDARNLAGIRTSTRGFGTLLREH